MKHKVYPECWLSGENFSPIKMKEIFPDISYKRVRIKGELGKRGRWGRKQIPEGSCAIFTPDTIEMNRVIWLCDFLIKNKNVLLKLGVSEAEMIIHLQWFGYQGNMELNRFEIKKLSETDLDVAMDYHFLET